MDRPPSRREFLAAALAGPGLLLGARPAMGADGSTPAGGGVFRAGAAAVDASPRKLPAIVNGYTFERVVNVVRDPLYARCLVLGDGTTRLAIVVVDICVMPRDLIDRAKQRASELTGIPVDRMLVSATHTHSAPSAMGALGSRADADYVEYLPGRIAEAVRLAAGNLAPARIGWAVADASEYTHSRRWIMRPDRVGTDPFGRRCERARLCPGYQNPGAVGPAGPVDAALSLVSVETPEGRPMALLANFGLHYFHAAPISAGFYGRFARQMTKLLGAEDQEPAFVAMMSQGTSGDQMYMDYSRPDPKWDIDSYTRAVAQVAFEACRKIDHRDGASLAMAERVLRLRRRVPDAERLAWARQRVAAMQGRRPKNRPEIFAREQIYLHEEPAAELKLQALRIGELGVTAIPCEVYGITGLKLKALGPLVPTLNITLANGEEGYIPPPEQHVLGGYSTWEARTAGLEEQAEPKIVEAVLGLLEQVAGRPRRDAIDPAQGAYAKAILGLKPVAYWRMSEFGGGEAVDCSGNANHGRYEDGVAFYLEGPPRAGCGSPDGASRAAHYAGGRIKAAVEGLGRSYSVGMWFSNGMPGEARAVAGYFFSRGVDGAEGAPGDHLGIGGTAAAADRLIFFNGNGSGQLLEGETRLELNTWHSVVLVRDGRDVSIYLDGDPEPEIAGQVDVSAAQGPEQLFVGGRSDNFANFAGKIGEVAVFDRTLLREEIVQHYGKGGHGVSGS